MKVPFTQQLSFRQAVYAVIVGFLLGFLLTSLEITLDYYSEQAQVQRRIEQLVETVRDSATQAAFFMDELLANKVVSGLFQNNIVNHAMIQDNLGTILASAKRTPQAYNSTWLIQLITNKQDIFAYPLKTDKLPDEVGTIAVTVDNLYLADKFISRAKSELLTNLVHNVFLVGVLFGLFYFTLTRPLLAMAGHFSQIDLDRPQNVVSPVPRRIRHNELGLLFKTINHMLERCNQALAKQREIEHELQKSEKKYRQIFENIQDVYYESTLEGNILEVSQSVESVLGIAREQMLNDNIIHYYVDPTQRSVFINALIKAERVDDYELQLTDGHGAKKHCSITAVLAKDEQNNPDRIIGSIRDITARKQTEQQLAEYMENLEELVKQRTQDLAGSERRYRAVVEDQTELICRFDKQGRLSFVNRAYETYFGQNRETLLGQSFFPFIHQSDKDHVLLQLAAMNRESPTTTVEERVVLENDQVRWLEWSNRAFFDDTGTLIEYQAVGRDITERKKFEEERLFYEEQLRQSHKMEALGVLADGIAHNFNNFLQGIEGHLQLLTLKKEDDDPELVVLNNIGQITANAKNEVDRLLMFTDMEQGVETEFIELNQTVRQFLASFTTTLGKKIELEVELGPLVGTINFPARHLERVLMSICTNAVEAMANGGRMRITSDIVQFENNEKKRPAGLSAGSYYLLQIKDWGPGIHQDVMNHIFEPFFTTKGIGGGTGLGLSVAYGLIKRFHGQIVCTSTPGEGTVFSLYFPAAEGEAHAAGGSGSITGDSTTPPDNVCNVMLVDDEEMVLAPTTGLLENFGYKVYTAQSGEEALEIYRQQKDTIDIVVLDLGMPGMGGEKCLEQLCQTDPGVKVIIASGYSTSELARNPVQYGAVSFISKPYRVDDLMGEIQKHL